MRLHLITHAHTAVDPAVDARRWGLSPRGEREAAALAREPFWGGVALVALSSERKTALSAAPALASRDLPVLEDDRLDELRRPSWLPSPEAYRERVAAAFAAPGEAAGDWEPAEVALARVRAAVEEIVARRPRGDVALVGHGLALSLLRASLLGQDRARLEDWRRLDFCARAVVVAGEAGWRWAVDFAAVAGADGGGRGG